MLSVNLSFAKPLTFQETLISADEGVKSAMSPPMCFPNMDVLGGAIKNKVLSDLFRKLSDL